MTVNIRKKEGVIILDVEGKVIGSGSLELKEIISEEIKSMPEGEVRLLLDLGKVPMMDSSGLGVVVAAYTSIKRRNGRIALLKAGKNIKSLIVMAKLMTIFDRYDDEDEAIAALKE